MKLLLIPAVAILAGCTSMDKKYAAHLAAAQSIAQANALASQEKVRQIGEIARASADPSAKTAAVMALAFIQTPQSQLPAPPESQALKWASVLLPAVTNLGAGYFGYRLGVTQSDNAAATAIASYNTFGSMANAGYSALGNTASAGFAANTGIAGFIQAPQPNVTLSGQGVIGSGSYSFSAPVTTTSTTTTNTTTTSSSNNTTRSCNGGGTTTGDGGQASC